MTRPPLPRATYRLQFNADFTLEDARRIVPYLHTLGISHVYASPLLRARAGSPHGYDIVDHGSLNPEIGSLGDLGALVETLRAHGMGLILDIVPNHMGVFGHDNLWWLDVLEHGPSSIFAGFFDIDWRPLKLELQNKLLLPCLGDHYGHVLDRGELTLGFDTESGRFQVEYYEHLFPVDPATYAHILNPMIERLRDSDARAAEELAHIAATLEQLPPRERTTPEIVWHRRAGATVERARLASLIAANGSVRQALYDALEQCNGEDADRERFHRLLEAQAYRLAYWKVAADEINYRRFFDINELAGLRTERPAVFDATHGLILDLVARGWIDGLRIDHPDGLYDPLAYYRRLVQALNRACGSETDDGSPLYLIVEKILAPHESLPEDWPVHGTSGYDFAFEVNDLFVQPGSARRLRALYHRYTGRHTDFDELLYTRKKHIIRTHLSSELSVLSTRLDRIAEADRHTRDFTLNGLRDALMEIVACFPVYRSYIRPGQISEQDRRYVDWAVSQAKQRSRTADQAVFDFIHYLLLEGAHPDNDGIGAEIGDFIQGLQQYTGPVMAKSMEDTAFYSYDVLVSLNEVGGDPRRFGVSIPAFHHAAAERAARWPHSLLATSTHDAKRSEDLRQRINVISELPLEWEEHLQRWTRLNRDRHRLLQDDQPAPSRNDEYLIYQTLVGLWPEDSPGDEERARLAQRLRDYMLKAIREAKEHSSWLNPDTQYEQATADFVDQLLDASRSTAFLSDFEPFQQRLARLGALNSLSESVIKATAPGIPDFYQGAESRFLALVDPDNRRPVDFTQQQQRQAQLDPAVPPRDVHGMAFKHWLTWRLLSLRAEHEELFTQGEYQPVMAEGPLAEHIVAFARRQGKRIVLIAALRWFSTLTDGDGSWTPDRIDWGDTRLALPETTATPWLQAFTGAPARSTGKGGNVNAGELFQHLPFMVLANEV